METTKETIKMALLSVLVVCGLVIINYDKIKSIHDMIADTDTTETPVDIDAAVIVYDLELLGQDDTIYIDLMENVVFSVSHQQKIKFFGVNNMLRWLYDNIGGKVSAYSDDVIAVAENRDSMNRQFISDMTNPFLINGLSEKEFYMCYELHSHEWRDDFQFDLEEIDTLPGFVDEEYLFLNEIQNQKQ